MNETNQKSILHLPDPEPWHKSVNGPILLKDIADRIRKYVALPEGAAETLALWVVHTYAFELRDISTYIGIESPEKRCGKTTLLRLLGQMVARPVIAANISPPALFRVIEEAMPTLLIDEADTFLDGNEELRGILNSGYDRATAYVVRVRQGTAAANQKHAVKGGSKRSQLERFSCWCPKAMAAIGRLGETLSDRCITIRMQRKTSVENCAKLRDYMDEGLRSQCLRFVGDNAQAIGSARLTMPEELNDRAADVWEPLMVLAEVAGGEWPKIARDAALLLAVRPKEVSPISALLADIFIVFACRGPRISTAEMVRNLEDFGERPYKEGLKEKAIGPAWLAKQLRPYGIVARPLWMGDALARGFERDDFMDVFRRYTTKDEIRKIAAERCPATPKGGKNPEVSDTQRNGNGNGSKNVHEGAKKA